MQVPFGVSAYDLNEYGLPTVELENWYPTLMPHLGQARLVPTPGLTLFQSASTGVRGVFQSDGALSGQIVYADGTALERLTSGGTNTTIATVASDDHDAQFAASQADLVATSGGTAYVVESGSVTAITVGNATGDIISVTEIGQRHLFAEAGEGRFWWSAVADPTTVSATSFATAETEPDDIRGIVAHRGIVWVLGATTIEGWVPTGSVDQAFASTGRVIDNGVIGRDAWCKTDDAVFVVAPDGKLFRLSGTQRERVSTDFIEARIKDLSAANQAKVKLRSYQWRGHEFIRITLPGSGCWNYDLATGAWHRARSLGVETHIVSDFVSAFGSTYAVGAGGVYTLSRSVYTEAGAAVRRVAQALIPVDDNRPTLTRATVFTSTEGVPLSGQGSDPMMVLRVARDGVTFGAELFRTAPKAGEYSKPITWGPLGHVRPPVCKLELAMTDPIGTTLADVKLNMGRP